MRLADTTFGCEHVAVDTGSGKRLPMEDVVMFSVVEAAEMAGKLASCDTSGLATPALDEGGTWLPINVVEPELHSAAVDLVVYQHSRSLLL